jgi:aminoglycoside phosphotransferase family enzyme/predicted kinase
MKSADVEKLLNPDAFPHAVKALELIETHISWVILTGEFAYKIKKPVDLGFINFTGLERRKHFCEEELRLNRRTAPDLYLDVVPIAETPQGPRVGQEPAIEYAVRMRQFPAEARLDRQLESGRLATPDALLMAQTIAAFHDSLSPRPADDPEQEFALASRFALDNFHQIKAALPRDSYQPLLSRLEEWTRQQLPLIKTAFVDRVASGLLRECHGDLHLGNMVRRDSRIVLFDCIEFDPDLRWLDPMNDIAFLVMDLMAHQRADLALVFLNAYLEKTGDYPGLAVLRFYLVYRCMVRAKVSALQPGNSDKEPSESTGGKTRRYLELAQSLVERAKAPHLYLMHGFSGSGKTWLSNQLIGELKAIRVRSDLERKRLHGLASGQSSESGIETGLYDPTATKKTYDCLKRYCETGLRAGFTMIADAGFLRRWQRRKFLRLATEMHVEAFLLDCTAPPEVLRERVQKRLAGPEQASEADLQVLQHQLAHHDPFADEEAPYLIRVATNENDALNRLLKQLAKHQAPSLPDARAET